VPTNKLWLEHTEQAAWQSVDALREKLALAEQRQARLAPPVEGWQELLDGLDRAKSDHGVAGDSYAAVLRALLERLAQVAELAQSAARAEPRLVEQGPSVVEIERQTTLRTRRGKSASFDDEEPAGEPAVHGETRLFREIRARYQELVRGRGREGASAVLSDIEARLGDLPDLDPGELSDVAADLAALALLLTRSSADE
jgi:hypothetical protein